MLLAILLTVAQVASATSQVAPTTKTDSNRQEIQLLPPNLPTDDRFFDTRKTANAFAEWILLASDTKEAGLRYEIWKGCYNYEFDTDKKREQFYNNPFYMTEHSEIGVGGVKLSITNPKTGEKRGETGQLFNTPGTAALLYSARSLIEHEGYIENVKLIENNFLYLLNKFPELQAMWWAETPSLIDISQDPKGYYEAEIKALATQASKEIDLTQREKAKSSSVVTTTSASSPPSASGSVPQAAFAIADEFGRRAIDTSSPRALKASFAIAYKGLALAVHPDKGGKTGDAQALAVAKEYVDSLPNTSSW